MMLTPTVKTITIIIMAGYTKLFSTILASTIWRAPDKTRIVWITLLAMADQRGVAEGSVPGLADFARVSVDECRAALTELMAPDPDSRTKDWDGRRIEEVDGGWLLLNHGKYRAKMNADERREYLRKKQAEHRARTYGALDGKAERASKPATGKKTSRSNGSTPTGSEPVNTE